MLDEIITTMQGCYITLLRAFMGPQDLVEDVVHSFNLIDFMVVTSSDNIWLTIKGSKNILTLDLRSMECNV